MHEWMGGLIGERGRDHGVAKCLENVTAACRGQPYARESSF